MRITKREKVLLYILLEFDIHRYLLANTYNRHDPVEKAEEHMKIASIIFSYIFAREYNEHKDWQIMMIIHDCLAEILTNRLDEVIGFPIDKESCEIDYHEFGKRFFNVIIKNIDKIKERIEEEKKTNNTYYF
jgi:hypothetical protein